MAAKSGVKMVFSVSDKSFNLLPGPGCHIAKTPDTFLNFWTAEMKYFQAITLASLAIVFLLAATDQLTAQTAQNAGPTSTAETKKTIGFRSVAWQTRHIHDMAVARDLIASLKKIGCEVTQHDHNGHLDVRYRCATWKSITVENDEFAKQWTEWLVGYGMETVRVDPPDTPGLEIVRFRKADWQNLHLHDAAKAGQIMTMLKMIGCEADQHEHDGHIDVRFRTGDWKTIALHNHDAAHGWQEWLDNLGFETEHSH